MAIRNLLCPRTRFLEWALKDGALVEAEAAIEDPSVDVATWEWPSSFPSGDVWSLAQHESSPVWDLWALELGAPRHARECHHARGTTGSHRFRGEYEPQVAPEAPSESESERIQLRGLRG